MNIFFFKRPFKNFNNHRKHFWFHGVIYSAVSMTTQSLTQRCQWQHKVWLSGVNDNIKSDSAVSMKTQSLTKRRQWQHKVWLSSVNDNIKSDSAVSMTTQSLTQRCQWHQIVFLHMWMSPRNQSCMPKYFIMWILRPDGCKTHEKRGSKIS